MARWLGMDDEARAVTLVEDGGVTADPTWEQIATRSGSTAMLWLDLVSPTDEDVEALGDVFSFHRLAIEDTQQFGHRPRLVPYDDHAFIVAFGATGNSQIEVHLYYRPGVVVTVRRRRCRAIDERLRQGFDHEFDTPGLYLLYELMNALVASFPPVLDDIDDRLGELENAILADTDPTQMSQLTALKRRLSHLRRAIVPSRDTLGGGTSLAIEELPGMTDDARRYFRDLYDHLVHVADQVDSEREHASSVMEVYLSSVSNKQNEVMKQLTAVSTIFLPLMFLTGFFGMNFAWMVRHVEGSGAFLVLGIGLQLASVAALLVLLKRRGWF